jgi:ribose transport system permease protein
VTSTSIRPTIEDDGAERVTFGQRFGELRRRQEVTLAGVIIVFCAAVAILNPAFLSAGNVINMLQSTVVFFVIACPLTLVQVAGGFDFSIGSTFTLGAISATWLMSLGLFWPLAILAGMAFGTVVGLINSLLIERLNVPPIITTLGTFYFIAGAVVLFTGGVDIQPLPDGFNAFGQGAILGVPNLIIYGVVIGVIYHLLLQRTPFGYNVKAVGGGRAAANANGISARRVNMWLYSSAGGVAALAGILFASQTGSGQVSAGGASVTLTAISAVLIGGTSLFGGVGTIAGTALGALLFAAINNGLAVANVPALYSSMIIGAILVAAVALDSFRRKRSVLSASALKVRS